MGTWGFRLYENDTFCEVVEYFKQQAMSSVSAENICLEVLAEYQTAPDYVLVEEAIIECLWRLGAVTEEHISAVRRIIDEQKDHGFWAELEADEVFLRNRASEMSRFLNRISKPPTPSQRWKLKPTEACPLQKGSCFWYKSVGAVYGSIVLEVQMTERVAFYLVALSEKLQSIPKTVDEILSAPVYTIAWFSDLEMLNSRRVHLVGSVSIEQSYINKYGLLSKPDGMLRMSNCGQSATWKHTFLAMRFRDAVLCDFVK